MPNNGEEENILKIFSSIIDLINDKDLKAKIIKVREQPTFCDRVKKFYDNFAERALKALTLATVAGSALLTYCTLNDTLTKVKNEIKDRETKLIAENWSILTKERTNNQEIDDGRKSAIVFLHNKNQVLFNINLNKVPLPYLDLPFKFINNKKFGAQFQNSKFRQAILSHAFMPNANLGSVDFSSPDRRNTSQITHVNFNEASLLQADLKYTGIKNSCFIGANLERVKINSYTDFQGGVFSNQIDSINIQYFYDENDFVPVPLKTYLELYNSCVNNYKKSKEKKLGNDQRFTYFKNCIDRNIYYNTLGGDEYSTLSSDEKKKKLLEFQNRLTTFLNEVKILSSKMQRKIIGRSEIDTLFSDTVKLILDNTKINNLNNEDFDNFINNIIGIYVPDNSEYVKSINKAVLIKDFEDLHNFDRIKNLEQFLVYKDMVSENLPDTSNYVKAVRKAIKKEGELISDNYENIKIGDLLNVINSINSIDFNEISPICSGTALKPHENILCNIKHIKDGNKKEIEHILKEKLFFDKTGNLEVIKDIRLKDLDVFKKQVKHKIDASTIDCKTKIASSHESAFCDLLKNECTNDSSCSGYENYYLIGSKDEMNDMQQITFNQEHGCMIKKNFISSRNSFDIRNSNPLVSKGNLSGTTRSSNIHGALSAQIIDSNLVWPGYPEILPTSAQ